MAKRSLRDRTRCFQAFVTAQTCNSAIRYAVTAAREVPSSTWGLPTLRSSDVAASTARIAAAVYSRVAMSDSTIRSSHAKLETAIALARVLERVERGAEPVNAEQYQVLVARVKAALSEDLPEPVLNAILSALPAAAEVYENMHYRLSGLSRSPLDRSVSSEMLTAKLLTEVSRASKRA